MSVNLPLSHVNPQIMAKLILLMLLLVTGSLPTWAQPAAADDIEQLQKQMKSYTAKQVIEAFSQSVESHRNGAARNDDLTMLAIRCLCDE